VSAELFVFGAEDERGPHRRCTGHVTGSSEDLVTCPLRATRVIWEPDGASFACDDPGHVGEAIRSTPIGEFFMELTAQDAQRALEDCVDPT
jgi:hypothetical protein